MLVFRIVWTERIPTNPQQLLRTQTCTAENKCTNSFNPETEAEGRRWIFNSRYEDNIKN